MKSHGKPPFSHDFLEGILKNSEIFGPETHPRIALEAQEEKRKPETWMASDGG